MSYGTYSKPIKPDDWKPTFAEVHESDGKLRYTAPNGRVFIVTNFGSFTEAYPVDDPFHNYWAPTPCWAEMKQSIDLDNPAA